MTRRLALGTVQFGIPYGIANRNGQVGQSEIDAILRYAREEGIDTLDTAIDYGESERRLGEVGVGNWRVITKLPALGPHCSDVAGWLNQSLARSLTRLHVTNLHGLLLHRPEDLLGEHGAGLYRAMVDAKSDGIVEKIGVSIYDAHELDNLCARYAIDIVQAPLSVFDRRIQTSGWLARLHEAGIEFHARSIFLQGLLLMNATDRPSKFERWQSLWKQWDAWLDSSRLTALQACVGFAFSQAYIDRVVVGVQTVTELKEIVAAIGAQTVEAPLMLATEDVDLINPSRWGLH